MVLNKDKIQAGYKWYSTGQSTSLSHVCQNRALFQARLSSLYQMLIKNYPRDSVLLLNAVVAEIGINCFDHNIGKWEDIPGCWFDYELEQNKIKIVIADRGQGIFSSLKRVVPELKNDQEALEMAFQKRISGRSPEQRGNGLKFVRNIINGNKDRALLYYSGGGKILLGGLMENISEYLDFNQKSQRGTCALLTWSLDEN
ncbi:MAG: hypothetical protein HYS98_07325 [Deltaproteobacteria bacterium]|nr:hypothetical protein [Deltaproteobacteria bacterium]